MVHPIPAIQPHFQAKFVSSLLTLSFHSDILKIVLAVILPPLGVFLERGCGADLCINVLLTILGKSLDDLPRIAGVLCSIQSLASFPPSLGLAGMRHASR